jgi:hypothetical protein
MLALTGSIALVNSYLPAPTVVSKMSLMYLIAGSWLVYIGLV